MINTYRYRSGYRTQMLSVGGGMTPAVKYLIIANAAIFLLELAGTQVNGFLISHLALIPDSVVHQYGVWCLVTYMFLHSAVDPWHILLNMLALWMFGIIFERIWGTIPFLVFYLVSGFVAGLFVLFSAFLFPEVASIPTIGASGAIFALLMAFGLWFPESYIQLYFFIPIKAKYFVISIVAITFIFALSRSGTGVSYSAHAGGLFTGFVLTTGIWHPSVMKTSFKRLFLKIKELWLRQKLRAYEKKRRQIRRVDDDEFYH